MTATDSLFKDAVPRLLAELFHGASPEAGGVFNPGDPGLLRQLDSIDAAVASKPPAPGRPTIAAHVDHVRYSLELLNRWAGGEADPWADSDWDASWRRNEVTDVQWALLRKQLHEAATSWQSALAARTSWDELSATGAVANAMHTAYHIGAIRQIFALVSR